MKMNSHKFMNFLHINTQSIAPSKINTPKSAQLETLIGKINPDIISINETFLKPKNQFLIDGYQILRNDRVGKKGGGCALCIKNSIPGTSIPMTIKLLQDNALGFEFETLNKTKLAIFTI